MLFFHGVAAVSVWKTYFGDVNVVLLLSHVVPSVFAWLIYVRHMNSH